MTDASRGVLFAFVSLHGDGRVAGVVPSKVFEDIFRKSLSEQSHVHQSAYYFAGALRVLQVPVPLSYLNPRRDILDVILETVTFQESTWVSSCESECSFNRDTQKQVNIRFCIAKLRFRKFLGLSAQ